MLEDRHRNCKPNINYIRGLYFYCIFSIENGSVLNEHFQKRVRQGSKYYNKNDSQLEKKTIIIMGKHGWYCQKIKIVFQTGGMAP